MFKEQIDSFLEKEQECEKAIAELQELLDNEKGKKLNYKKARTALEKLEEQHGQITVSA